MGCILTVGLSDAVSDGPDEGLSLPVSDGMVEPALGCDEPALGCDEPALGCDEESFGPELGD